jgi:hypothetical protein
MLDPKKDVHPLYQLQVVFNDDDIKITLTKSRKWPTHSGLTKILIGIKPPKIFMCSHFKAPIKFLLRYINRSSKIKR